jgi:hypothetical protein
MQTIVTIGAMAICSLRYDLPPSRPAVEVFTLPDQSLAVRSEYVITHIELSDLWERADYFIEYSGDRKEARILLRVHKRPIDACVETKSSTSVVDRQHWFRITGKTISDNAPCRAPVFVHRVESKRWR